MIDLKCDIDLERFADGECTLEEAACIRQHLSQCETCSAELDALRKFNLALRANMATERASPELRLSVLRNIEEQRGRAAPEVVDMSRRRFSSGAVAAIAASAAAAVVLPSVIGMRPMPERFASTLISDYETFLSAERALDYVDGDAGRLAAWYRARLSFALPQLPAAIGDNILIGGRLCWLFDRRLAALTFDGEDGPLSLYVMQADGLDLPKGDDMTAHRRDRFTNVVWRRGDLAISLVGKAHPDRMKSIARTLMHG